MKNIHIVIKSLLLVLLFISCRNNEDNIDPSGDVKATPPLINNLSKSNWMLTKPASNENPFIFRLSWNKVKYNYYTGEYFYVSDVTYEVQMDLADHNFSSPKTVAKTANLFTDFYTVDLKKALDELLGSETNTPQNVSFRIKAISSQGTVYSDALTLTLTSYFNIDPVVKNIFIIGDMNGWNNANKDYVMFRTSNDYNDGAYTYTGYFPTATYFKFNSEEDLGSFNHMYCAGANGTLVQGDLGAFYVAAGYHTITIDIKKMTWAIADANINNPKTYDTMGPIGGFCNWDNEPLMSRSGFDPHQWRITYDFASSSACKFRGNKNWANNWGGNDADIPYGKGIFDGSGATIQNPGKYDIYFNDLTGHYAILKH